MNLSIKVVLIIDDHVITRLSCHMVDSWEDANFKLETPQQEQLQRIDDVFIPYYESAARVLVAALGKKFINTLLLDT
jgi:hypothetical protein